MRIVTETRVLCFKAQLLRDQKTARRLGRWAYDLNRTKAYEPWPLPVSELDLEPAPRCSDYESSPASSLGWIRKHEKSLAYGIGLVCVAGAAAAIIHKATSTDSGSVYSGTAADCVVISGKTHPEILKPLPKSNPHSADQVYVWAGRSVSNLPACNETDFLARIRQMNPDRISDSNNFLPGQYNLPDAVRAAS